MNQLARRFQDLPAFHRRLEIGLLQDMMVILQTLLLPGEPAEITLAPAARLGLVLLGSKCKAWDNLPMIIKTTLSGQCRKLVDHLVRSHNAPDLYLTVRSLMHKVMFSVPTTAAMLSAVIRGKIVCFGHSAAELAAVAVIY